MKLPHIHHIKRKEWIIYSVALGFFAFFLVRLIQQAEVQRRYGFRVGSPDIGGINGCEVLMVNHIRTGGVFDRAGIGIGDVLINDHKGWSVQKFLKETLDQPAGTKVIMEVIPFDCHDYDCDKINDCDIVKICIVAP